MGNRGEHAKSFAVLCQFDLSFGELTLLSCVMDFCNDC